MFLSNTRQVLVGFCSEGLYLIRASAQLSLFLLCTAAELQPRAGGSPARTEVIPQYLQLEKHFRIL